MLTTYTKLNKSASIFLGSNSKSTCKSRATNAHSHDSRSTSTSSVGGESTNLNRRKDSMTDLSYKSHPHAEEQKSKCGLFLRFLVMVKLHCDAGLLFPVPRKL